ncbi:TAT-variant-translocated molybdopterin oxidoreductase [candidate division KSB1 bacterium]
MTDATHINGKHYWRSLDELSQTSDFRKFVEREFPDGASELHSDFSRRKFLTLMGASLSLAGLAGCRRPVEKIIPYVTQPEEIVPGIPRYYATTMPFCTDSYGLIAESHEGRPTKIEGNTGHISTRGSSNAFMQASILGLYDPDRSKRVVRNGTESNREEFVSAWRTLYTEHTVNRGEGLAVLAESFASPTLSRLESAFKTQFPRAKWITYEPVSDENIYNGIETATGRKYQALYRFEKAKRIVSIDSDFLQLENNNTANTRGFSEGRRITSEHDEMNRLYVVESGFTVTGSHADHRLRLQSRQMGAFTAALALELQRRGLRIDGLNNVDFGPASAIESSWISAAAGDLMETRGESIVIAGRRQSAGVHALVYAINSALGNIGNTIEMRDVSETSLPDRGAFADLMSDLNSSSVETLVILGCNPVYNAPADAEFARNMTRVNTVIHFGLYEDETGREADWHVPQAHFLESWGDTRNTDGTRSIIQPLIEPLFGGKMPVEFFNLLSSGEDSRGYDIIRTTWRNIIRRGDFEEQWRKTLHDGVLSTSTVSTTTPPVNGSALGRYLNDNQFTAETAGPDSLEIVFTASASTFDGRFANNGWLQELPDPITKLTWDNPAVISPNTAEELGLRSGDMVKLSYAGRELELPIWIIPGHADNTVSVELGYGRTAAGMIGNGVGFNTFLFRTGDAPDIGAGLRIEKTGSTYEMACVQDHWSLEGRPHLLEATLEEYREDPEFEHQKPEHPPLRSMWTEHSYDEGYQWGMAIDLNTCTGCNACTIACQSENNIPIVGKEQVINGREMHWIRIDRYFSSSEGHEDNPEMLHQPMTCLQCENAPCEQVCPVAATSHDREGLNTMTYNRCIGTRYCSNNCPVKVRRFNFFNYTKDTQDLHKMANNPDVTVRSRGVMEKCTYCVQRISRSKINAKLEGREVGDGEVVTACEQACPAKAIVFGNINDPESRVSQVKRQNRDYHVLEELNIKPRTSYHAKLRNPHPDLE